MLTPTDPYTIYNITAEYLRLRLLHHRHVLLSALAQTAHPPPPECNNKSGLFVDGRYCKSMSQVKMALVLRSTNSAAEEFEMVDIDGCDLYACAILRVPHCM